jgi:uncharacterized protein
MRKVTVLFVFLLSFTFVYSQLCWEISGNGLKKSSYLFGTHHLIEKEKIPAFDQYRKLIKKVDAVVGELDMSNMLSMQMKIAQAAIMKDQSLTDFISKETFDEIAPIFKEVTNYNLNQFARMKPMMVSSLYTVMLYKKVMELKKDPESVDQFFQKEGKKQKKSIIALETTEEQIDVLFNTIPLDKQAEYFVKSLKENDKTIDVLLRMNEAYLQGDLTVLQSLMESEDMTPEVGEILLENRNNNWMVKLLKILPETSCFIAVGSGHLPGSTGLIVQLRNAGYTVTPVTN